VKRLPAMLLAAVALLAGFRPLQAQTEPAPAAAKEAQWYRVELLIFANRDSDAALSETWPLLPELAYPASLQQLQQRPYLESARRDFELRQFDQFLPEPAFDLAWDTPVEQLLHEHRQNQRWRRPSIQLEPLFELDVPVPFALLPSSTIEFASQRRRLNRAGNTEVLFHQTWLQPTASREASIPLQVQSTTLSGDYPELQGSILLYSARYLHVETNLWLNTDGSYLDTAWSMPVPPLPPAEKTAQPMPVFALTPSPQWLAEPARPPSGTELLIEESTAGTPAETPAETAVVMTLSEEMLAAWLARPEYNYRHAVLMQQRRRMRSSEVHYLDHPLLGILIKVSRYEFEPFVDTSDQLRQTDSE
jgi:hypothetical protein